MQRFLPLSLLALLIACASPPDPYEPLASSQLMFCANNEQMVLSLGDKAAQAAVSFHGRTLTLPRIKARHGDHAFGDSVYQLHYDEDKGAALEREGLPFLSGCKPEPD